MARKIDPMVFLLLGAIVCSGLFFTCFRAVSKNLMPMVALNSKASKEFDMNIAASRRRNILTVIATDTKIPADSMQRDALAKKIARWVAQNASDSTPVNTVEVMLSKIEPGSIVPKKEGMSEHRFSADQLKDVAPGMTCNERRMTGEGVGMLRVGAPVPDVLSGCVVTNDTVMLNAGVETRVLSVAMDKDTLFAEATNDRISNVLVRSQGIYTADSLSVGTSVATLVQLPDLQPVVGDGYLYAVTPSHCGMSFRLSVPPKSLKSGKWTIEELRKLSPYVHVTRILLRGCKQ